MGLFLSLVLLLQPHPDPEGQARGKGLSHLQKRTVDFGESWELVLLTLVRHSDGADVAVERKLLDRMLRQPPQTTRSAALQAMTLRELREPRHRERMAYCAQFLLDNQCADGLWDAGRPVAAPELPPLPPSKPGVREFGKPDPY